MLPSHPHRHQVGVGGKHLRCWEVLVLSERVRLQILWGEEEAGEAEMSQRLQL